MKGDKLTLISFLLRVGLALVFLYAAVSSFLNPLAWVGFFPILFRNFIPESVLLFSFSIYEILLALWLFSSWKAFYAAIVSGLTLLVVILGNLGALDVIFRDISILFMAAALAVIYWENK